MNVNLPECAQGELLVDYAEGLLGREQSAALESHLAACRRCAEELQAIRELKAQAAALVPLQAPEAGLDSLLAYARKSTRVDRPSRTPRTLQWVVSATSAMTIAAAAVVVLLLRPQVPATVVLPVPAAPPVVSAPQAVAAAPPAATAAPAQAEPPPVALTSPTPAPVPRKVARAEPAAKPSRAAAADPEEAITPEPKKKAKGGVDDDFERIFGGGGSDEEEEEAPKKKAKSAYIPPAPGGGGAPSSLAQSDIMGVVLAHKGAIKACVDRQKAVDPDGSGTLVMRWTIKPSGATANVKTVSDEFKSSPMASCMSAAIRGWKFPSYSGPEMAPIDFPFKF